MSAPIPSPDGAVENDRHHHHDRHPVEMDAAVTLAPTPDTDPIAVIEAAGGIVTDWTGRPCLNGGRVLAAANATIHAEALALLNG